MAAIYDMPPMIYIASIYDPLATYDILLLFMTCLLCLFYDLYRCLLQPAPLPSMTLYRVLTDLYRCLLRPYLYDLYHDYYMTNYTMLYDYF